MKDDEKMAFDVYFASIASMQFHPGAGTKAHEALTLEQCRDKALEMIELRKSAMNEEN
jgi:hypothetical protein